MTEPTTCQHGSDPAACHVWPCSTAGPDRYPVRTAPVDGLDAPIRRDTGEVVAESGREARWLVLTNLRTAIWGPFTLGDAADFLAHWDDGPTELVDLVTFNRPGFLVGDAYRRFTEEGTR